ARGGGVATQQRIQLHLGRAVDDHADCGVVLRLGNEDHGLAEVRVDQSWLCDEEYAVRRIALLRGRSAGDGKRRGEQENAQAHAPTVSKRARAWPAGASGSLSASTCCGRNTPSPQAFRAEARPTSASRP